MAEETEVAKLLLSSHTTCHPFSAEACTISPPFSQRWRCNNGQSMQKPLSVSYSRLNRRPADLHSFINGGDGAKRHKEYMVKGEGPGQSHGSRRHWKWAIFSLVRYYFLWATTRKNTNKWKQRQERQGGGREGSWGLGVGHGQVRRRSLL